VTSSDAATWALSPIANEFYDRLEARLSPPEAQPTKSEARALEQLAKEIAHDTRITEASLERASASAPRLVPAFTLALFRARWAAIVDHLFGYKNLAFGLHQLRAVARSDADVEYALRTFHLFFTLPDGRPWTGRDFTSLQLHDVARRDGKWTIRGAAISELSFPTLERLLALVAALEPAPLADLARAVRAAVPARRAAEEAARLELEQKLLGVLSTSASRKEARDLRSDL
jgi:hypothetical protein